MSEIMTLLTGAWGHLAGGLAIVAALALSWFGGKKIGTTQTQAEADVKAAKVESAQVSAVAEKQKENTQAVKDVQQSNSALTDSAARDKLRQSQYNRTE
ncbi:hypothetical protein [Erwinia sp. E_sp_B04_7]|uniref:hypothetical protein n=1 Tax=unclassified Erwinia TaxID=2622719 RepID=UPI0030CC58AC